MKRNVIIDCDPGIDDSLALMLALSMEELEVVGVTIVCGNCPTAMGASNAKKVLRYLNRLDIPVFEGETRPIRRKYTDALDTHGRDGLGESFLPAVEGYEQEMGAVEFLEKKLLEKPCSVIALGPLTNLARLVQKNPRAFGRIEELVSMGGNFGSRGNCSPVAEYNYWADPDGAAMVYQAAETFGKKISMVGLDVTRKIVLTPGLMEYLKRLDPETGAFVEKITKFYFDFHWQQEHLLGCVINDPLAVAYFADRSLCRGFEAYTQVETEGVCAGQTVVDFTPGEGSGAWEEGCLRKGALLDDLSGEERLRKGTLGDDSSGKGCMGNDSAHDRKSEGAAWPEGLPDHLKQVNFYGHKANSRVLIWTDPLRFFRIFFGRILGVEGANLDLLPRLVREEKR